MPTKTKTMPKMKPTMTTRPPASVRGAARSSSTTSRAAELSADEVERFIQGNARLARAQPEQMDSIRSQVRVYLAEEAIYEELRDRYGVEKNLEPYRVEVAADGPAKGPEGAPVTIVEFSDFQCPYCKRVLPSIDQAVDKYGDKVRLLFRQFPLRSIHP